MTEFLLILGGLVLAAICLGVGYLLGKKKKVVAQIQGAIGKVAEDAKDITGKI